MRALLLAVAALLAALAGCASSSSGVKEFEIHVGWNQDGSTQYMRPNEIRVKQGDLVRFVVINDDDPKRDYNGAASGPDNFHDVALMDYDGDGDGRKEDIEHEAPAGEGAVATHFKDQDYFKATAKGTYEIICEVGGSPSHEQRGMRGTFVVE